jgi:hypothetical protein
VIVPPKIVWLDIKKRITKPLEVAMLVKELIQPLPYRKIIVWCGMISSCQTLSKLWKGVFPDFFIGVDTSLETTTNDLELFLDCHEKAILFCAAKHREGSDIKNLDGCVFLDGVIKRHSKTFIQCIGRVLRKDPLNKKTFGLVLDLKASSPSIILERMNQYMNTDSSIFPWHYSCSDNIHSLCMTKSSVASPNTTASLSNDSIKASTILSKFIRKIPETPAYQQRLCHEMNLLVSKNLLHYLLRALEILEITKNIPHVTRGSCGSSLVCYALGISHVDPVLHNIRFARFLHEQRNTLPDIDFDFPYHYRDQVFMQLELKWPGKVARISNHVYFHEKSAVRQALRNAGIRRFIAKDNIRKEINLLND